MKKQYKPKKCERCDEKFFGVSTSRRDWITRRFCSRECSDIVRRGTQKTSTTKNCKVCGSIMNKKYKEAWKRWNNKKFCSRECVTKGANYRAPSTAFKKGNKPWNFKKEGYGYQAVHKWINRHYSKTGNCSKCSKNGYTEWANVSGNYDRDISDFIELCKSCHAKEDATNPKRPKYTQS